MITLYTFVTRSLFTQDRHRGAGPLRVRGGNFIRAMFILTAAIVTTAGAGPCWGGDSGSGHAAGGSLRGGPGWSTGARSLDLGAAPGAQTSTYSRSTTAIFRVLNSTGPASGRWTIGGSGLTASLGSPVLWDSRGQVTGYTVVPSGAPVTVTSDTWSSGNTVVIPSLYNNAYAVSLYANNSNPPLRPDRSGMITPGYVPDLGAYHVGRGPGWVAVDNTTGNALLLSVSAITDGTTLCGGYSYNCKEVLLSQLGERSPSSFVHDLRSGDTFATSFVGAIPSNSSIVALGCSVLYPNVATTNTCTGGNLGVTITPVGVVRGSDLGVRGPTPVGGAAEGDSWSPGGTYTLNLTGLTVIY
ncbi:hypothetical protein DPZ68_23840 [Salmonella enterica subsp. enterica serovar Oranienburg]|nr:hypothetical protein [Salmonella enterica subsp. enterica serovar Oranienburg]